MASPHFLCQHVLGDLHLSFFGQARRHSILLDCAWTQFCMHRTILRCIKNGDSEYSEWRRRFWTRETARNYSSAGSSSFSPLSFSFSSCMAICTRDPSVLALEPIHCLYWSYLRLGSQCFSCQWWNRSRSGARTILKKRRGQHTNTYTVKVLATTEMLCRLFTRVGRPRFST